LRRASHFLAQLVLSTAAGAEGKLRHAHSRRASLVCDDTPSRVHVIRIMSSDKPTIADDEEFEIELTEGADLGVNDQRKTDRQETSSSLAGTVECRDKKIAVRINDLSLTGVGINLESRLPLNEECTLTIQLSVCGSEYELTMKCRVRHCDAENNKTYHAGLQFIDMTQGTRDTLALLIR
jgi:hypothetical protein